MKAVLPSPPSPFGGMNLWGRLVPSNSKGRAMKKMHLALSLIALSQAAFATGAAAATCADRTGVVANLAKHYGETLHAASITQDNARLEVFASKSKKTWTIMMVLPDGKLSCLVSSGKGFDSLEASMAPAMKLASN